LKFASPACSCRYRHVGRTDVLKAQGLVANQQLDVSGVRFGGRASHLDYERCAASTTTGILTKNAGGLFCLNKLNAAQMR